MNGYRLFKDCYTEEDIDNVINKNKNKILAWPILTYFPCKIIKYSKIFLII